MKLKTKNRAAQKKWSSRKVHGTSQTEVFEWRNIDVQKCKAAVKRRAN